MHMQFICTCDMHMQVLACAEPQLPLELAALAINVASDATAAASMSDSGGSAVRQLVDRLYLLLLLTTYY